MAFERLELAERLRHISQLVEKLKTMPQENTETRQLAERISQEIETARQQLKDLRKPK
jgi:hypothetical protein